jgi:Zinc knuckle
MLFETEMVEVRSKIDEMNRELGRLQALQPQRNFTEKRKIEQQTPSQSQNPQSGNTWTTGNQQTQRNIPPNSNACFNCEASGHFARECPKMRG